MYRNNDLSSFKSQMCPETQWAPVNYNSLLLIRVDKWILIENPLGDEFREKENQEQDKRRFRKPVKKKRWRRRERKRCKSERETAVRGRKGACGRVHTALRTLLPLHAHR